MKLIDIAALSVCAEPLVKEQTRFVGRRNVSAIVTLELAELNLPNFVI